MEAHMKDERVPGFGFYSTAEEVTEGIDASGITVLITGATSGLGAETARVLAMRGACVVLGVRNMDAGECTKANILQEIPHARLHVLHIDLSSMTSICNFCHTFKSLRFPLNILMNNAGVVKKDFELSEDGYEAIFSTNHLGHFLLTSLLLEDMKRTSQETGTQGKIINVSSMAHSIFTKGNKIQFETINDKSRFNPWEAYGVSKLSNILHANELARKFKEDGVNMVANSLHPGVILDTLVFRHFEKETVQDLIDKNQVSIKTLSQGAATQCFVALHPSVETCSGKYFVDCAESTQIDLCKNEKLSKDLWDFSVKATSNFIF